MAYSDEIIISDRFAKIFRRLASVTEWEGDMTKFLIFLVYFSFIDMYLNFICIIDKKKYDKGTKKLILFT